MVQNWAQMTIMVSHNDSFVILSQSEWQLPSKYCNLICQKLFTLSSDWPSLWWDPATIDNYSMSTVTNVTNFRSTMFDCRQVLVLTWIGNPRFLKFQICLWRGMEMYMYKDAKTFELSLTLHLSKDESKKKIKKVQTY